MLFRTSILIGSFLLVSGCSPAAMRVADTNAKSAPSSQSESVTGDQMDVVSSAASERLLAHRYTMRFQIPADSLSDIVENALDACVAAGDNTCQIVTVDQGDQHTDRAHAKIFLRAAPAWFKTYQADLLTSASDAKGELASSSLSSEDLTIQIVDTDAKLATLKTLRTRLTNLLAVKGSSVKDLVEVERELARVQGEREIITARSKVLKTRVSMVEARLTYQSKRKIVRQSTFSPVKYSATEFFGNVAYGLSGLIDFVAYVLPWLLLIIPSIWGLRKFWRRRKAKKLSASAK